MESHVLSKFTSAAIKPPVVAGTSTYRPLYERNLDEATTSADCDDGQHDTTEVKQYEPDNFRPVDNDERTGLQKLEVNRDTLAADFYGKVQALKKEHQKTLTVLNKFYESEKARCHSSVGFYDNNRRRRINHLIPDYLDLTKNNTFLYDNFPSNEPDLVPGFSKREKDEKRDFEKDDTRLASDRLSGMDSTDRVNRMWDDFSLDDYLNKSQMSENNEVRPPIRPASAPVKKKEWKPIITIPKPFNMTLREEQKKEKSHTRSSMDVSLRQKYREEEEDKERMKRIRAQEPPAHIYLPLYEEICERREQRSRFNKDNSIATTLAIQKPFSFAERDAVKLKLKKERLLNEDRRELEKVKKNCMFEAQDVPPSVHDTAVSDRLLENEYYRRVKIKMRAEDTMKAAALPPRMHSHELMAQKRRQQWLKDVERHTTYSFKPQTHELPDFASLHRQQGIEEMTRQKEVDTTVVKPFNLTSGSRSKERRKEKERKMMDESLESDSMSSFLKHQPGKMPALSDTLPARMTDSSRLRIENMRRSLQEADTVMARAKDEERIRKERKKMLAQRVKEKAALNDFTSSHVTAKDEKLRQYKKQLRERQKQYNKFLDEVKERVEGRPLLFEQHDEKIAKAQAEKRYREILETSGLSDEFVERKSQLSSTSDDFEPLTSKDLTSTRESYDAGSSSESSEESTDGKTFVKSHSEEISTHQWARENATDSDSSIKEKEENKKEKKKEKHVEFA